MTDQAQVVTSPAPSWDDALAALAPELTDLRHRLHRRPETGLQLPRTQRTVLEALEGLDLEVTRGTTSTSVTAVLRGGAPVEVGERPVVLLRGDLDALPVQEPADNPIRSGVDGVMHACGHDLHTAVLVGVARLLAARRDDLVADVVLMFQPGEEGHDGAAHMIAEGVLDAAGRRADAAYALHVIGNLAPLGTVLCRPGPLMAASDGLEVTVRGRGGHGSSPHLARDPLPAAADMVLALGQAVDRELDVFEPAVLTVGTFHAGTQRNIIAPTAVFEATVRTLDERTGRRVRELAERVCRGIAAAHGVEVDVTYRTEYPVTRNDAQAAAAVRAVTAELLGPGRYVDLANPIMGSEDFSRVLEQVPGAMFFLGACPPELDPATAPGNHAPEVRFDDRVLVPGVRLLAELVRRHGTA